VSPFQRVLVMQAFRPDRLQTAILNFCTDMLRIESVSPPPLSLAAMLAESSPADPILLISSPGADASKELQEFAAKTVGSDHYEELAMGGGQQEAAVELLRSAASAGSWLCLKNLHLVVAWLPTLEKELSSLEPHANFRLWLTTEAHHSFPSILLQQSLKATFESPPGIKKNLQRTFEPWEPDTFNSPNKTRSRLLFLLACFHAVMQERRTYIPQGWTKFYEFSYGDLRAGTFVMEVHIQ
jgi:dynein heavy chain 2